MEAELQAKLKEIAPGKWQLALSTDNKQKTEFLNMFLKQMGHDSWRHAPVFLLRIWNVFLTGENKMEVDFHVSEGPDVEDNTNSRMAQSLGTSRGTGSACSG